MATNEKDKSEATNAKNTSAEQKTSPTRTPNLTGLAALLLAILIGIISVYILHFVTSMNKGINEELEMTNNTIASLMDQQKNLHDNLKSNQEQLNKHIKTQKAKLAALEGEFTQTLDERAYQAEDWKILKARYLLEMAKINAHWQQDPMLSQPMLEQADRLLRGLHPPELYKVRQAIALEIQNIEKLEKADTVGLLSQIDAIQANIDALPVYPVKRPASNIKPEDASQSESGWQARWSNNLELLKKLVVIRHHHENATPMLLPEQRELLKARIHLSLEQAQLAVIQRNEAVFHKMIQKSIQQLAQFATEDAIDTSQIKNKLQALEKISIAMPKTQTGEALKALNAYIAGMQKKDDPAGSKQKKDEPA